MHMLLKIELPFENHQLVQQVERLSCLSHKNFTTIITKPLSTAECKAAKCEERYRYQNTFRTTLNTLVIVKTLITQWIVKVETRVLKFLSRMPHCLLITAQNFIQKF